MLIFVGYPGCGKSSLAQKLVSKHGYGVVNRDTLKTWQKCVEHAKIFLKRKQNVIIDNTNADKESRSHLAYFALLVCPHLNRIAGAYCDRYLKLVIKYLNSTDADGWHHFKTFSS